VKTLGVAIAVGIAVLYTLVAIRYCISVLRQLPRHERWLRKTKGLCPECGYDLTGNVSGVCPECGQAIAAENKNDARMVFSLITMTERQPWWVWGIVVATMVLATIAHRLFS
jgi:hypothetical protein